MFYIYGELFDKRNQHTYDVQLGIVLFYIKFRHNTIKTDFKDLGLTGTRSPGIKPPLFKLLNHSFTFTTLTTVGWFSFYIRLGGESNINRKYNMLM